MSRTISRCTVEPATESFAERKEKYSNYLAIGALYPEPVQIVVPANSPIRGIQDLKGKTVVVGAAASGTELASRQIFAAYGMTYAGSKDIKPLFLGFAEGATALRENSADALGNGGGDSQRFSS